MNALLQQIGTKYMNALDVILQIITHSKNIPCEHCLLGPRTRTKYMKTKRLRANTPPRCVHRQQDRREAKMQQLRRGNTGAARHVEMCQKTNSHLRSTVCAEAGSMQ